MTNPQSHSLKGADSSDDAENDSYRAEVNGDEAVGGSSAVPNHNDMEEMAKAVGIEVDDGTPLATEEILLKRDRDRWELDPASADKHYSYFRSNEPQE
ncbi:hypothetical protein PseudUWO311_08280 [Pseudanabaena sp. UWO311]|uniref:DUF6335 family protein n=1 Tax=Pseudanabaena sp. UWO311 TaxID=2487337 RepID=UPI00115B70D6|nr:DUF6335 family protein [Pseudanabaena sp. UWO311]TYQ27641.1 hypothetical protein PseudUWO311_08280 [Pseudanabaena sp. UWO311]